MSDLAFILLLTAGLAFFMLVVLAPTLFAAWSEDTAARARAERDLQWEMDDENVSGVKATLWLHRDRLPPERIADARAWLLARRNR